VAERRVLLVQAVAPPYPGGTNVVLERLLRTRPGWRTDVVTDRALRRSVRAEGAAKLDGRYRFVLKLPPLRPFAGIVHALNVPLAVVAGVRAAIAARRHGTSVVMTCFDGGFSQIAATVAARLAGVPLVVLVFDLWEENAYGRVERAVARLVERRLLRSAAALVVFCDTAAAHYADKHGVVATVLQIPLDPAAVTDDEPADPPRPGEPFEVFAAGALYWAQEDAVRRCAAAAAQVDGATLTIVGDERELRERGIEADRYEERRSGPDFRARIDRADVVFLGLSLRSPHPDIVRTATPARLVDYMAAARPLLIHAPAGSHVAEYARREDFAEVVSEPSVAALADGLRRLAADPDLARTRGARARELALTRHSASAVRDDLFALLERLT
jgi:glycosyltransferase involved in cell wall biosynthesis